MTTQSRTGSFLLGLSLALAYILGCVTSPMASPSPAVAQYAPPATSGTGQAWAYHCVEGYNAETLNQVANDLGAQGWEMVAAAGGGRLRGSWCFKRLR